MAEEKEAIAQYGSSDSGATLGDILGTALKRAGEKRAEDDADETRSSAARSRCRSCPSRRERLGGRIVVPSQGDGVPRLAASVSGAALRLAALRHNCGRVGAPLTIAGAATCRAAISHGDAAMPLDADPIVDRRRMRRKLTFWRVCRGAGRDLSRVVAVAAALRVPGTGMLTGAPRRSHRARSPSPA